MLWASASSASSASSALSAVPGEFIRNHVAAPRRDYHLGNNPESCHRRTRDCFRIVDHPRPADVVLDRVCRRSYAESRCWL